MATQRWSDFFPKTPVTPVAPSSDLVVVWQNEAERQAYKSERDGLDRMLFYQQSDGSLWFYKAGENGTLSLGEMYEDKKITLVDDAAAVSAVPLSSVDFVVDKGAATIYAKVANSWQIRSSPDHEVMPYDLSADGSPTELTGMRVSVPQRAEVWYDSRNVTGSMLRMSEVEGERRLSLVSEIGAITVMVDMYRN